MQYINRIITTVCKKDLLTFPILTLTGPRQSGKSTLLKRLLPDWRYVNLEEPQLQDFASEDPLGFVRNYDDKVIFDEIQRTPKLLSQLQVVIDKDRRPGRFAISGSHNLLLLEQVSQSLAGRTSVRNLLPFSYSELLPQKLDEMSLDNCLFKGGYPTVWESSDAMVSWLDSYIQTYIERDVRLIRNVSDLSMFRRFLRLCAGRAGQVLDLTGLGNDVGVKHNTIKDWIGLLEASFVAFRLEPYFKNFSKRIIKSPKLYFYDTGLLCRLLDIRQPKDLVLHPFRGAIFENWCIVEVLKSILNRGQRPEIYFWRDKSIEVDLLVQNSSTKLLALECKSAETPLTEFIESAVKLKKIVKDMEVESRVVFGGNESQTRSEGEFISWREVSREEAQ